MNRKHILIGAAMAAAALSLSSCTGLAMAVAQQQLQQKVKQSGNGALESLTETGLTAMSKVNAPASLSPNCSIRILGSDNLLNSSSNLTDCGLMTSNEATGEKLVINSYTTNGAASARISFSYTYGGKKVNYTGSIRFNSLDGKTYSGMTVGRINASGCTMPKYALRIIIENK